MELNFLSIAEAGAKLNKGEISARQLTEACLKRIAQVDDKLHACLTVAKDEALAAADEADKRLKAGERNPLLGIPFLVKDNILVKGLKATAASAMLANYVAPYDATVVAKLKTVGAVCLGKTNLDEFAHGASTEYSHFGPTKNPYDLTRSPGGSSGGSAAAVAAGLCLFALGTDTGGSVRHPASLCGVVGYKPTYGLCSRFGLIAMTSSTDVPGILGRNAVDVAMVLSVIKGEDDLDSTTIKSKVIKLKVESKFNLPAGEAGIQNSKFKIKNLKVGLAKEYFGEGIDEAVKNKVLEVVADLKKLGAKIIDVSLPHTAYGVSVYYIITPAEISSNLARFDGLRYGLKSEDNDLLKQYALTRGAAFGAEVKRRIMLGTYVLSAGYIDAYYNKAQAVKQKIKADFAAAFKQVDLLIAPTTPTTAFRLGEQVNDPLKMYMEDVFLTPSSLAGLPAVSLPAGLVDGLPVGCQLIGSAGQDELVLSTAMAYEKAVDIEQGILQV